ncbi:GIY-YIG nuclease family protein [Yokenella regensburgei]|uniref:GIY-YIG nuclease family protein n=1 Tax=Yokenella regensburgei TaxID=158877 RepID=UPI003ED9DC6F
MEFSEGKVKVSQHKQWILDKAMEIDMEPLRHMDLPDGFRNQGWVYALTNPVMPGLFKIGMTTSDPGIRAKEISQGTGIPMPFEVAKAYCSDNPREDEAEIHSYLDDFRVSQNREFFKCDLETLEEAASACGLDERGSSIEILADKYDVFCFDKRRNLDLVELFDELGIEVFGDYVATAEAMIRLSTRFIKTYTLNGSSVIFHENKTKRIIQGLAQSYEAYLNEHPEERNKPGLFHMPI